MDRHSDTSFILFYPVPKLVQASFGATSLSRDSLFFLHLYNDSEVSVGGNLSFTQKSLLDS